MDDAERNDRMLRRIIATLVALAVLAERAAYRSLPVRWLVLCLLRHAEAVTRKHIAETTGWDWPDLEQAFGIDADCNLDPGFDTDHGAGFDTGQGAGVVVGSGNGPADALALAWRLRALAAVLGAFLSPASGFDRASPRLGCPDADAEGALGRLAARLALILATAAGLPHPAPDTS
ncbi:MAG: hypothetical protein ACK4U0_09410 [Mesorhizobium sp.]